MPGPWLAIEPQKTIGARPCPIVLGYLFAATLVDKSMASIPWNRSNPFVAHGRGVSIITASVADSAMVDGAASNQVWWF